MLRPSPNHGTLLLPNDDDDDDDSVVTVHTSSLLQNNGHDTLGKPEPRLITMGEGEREVKH